MKTNFSLKSSPWDWYLFFSIFLYQVIPSFYNSYSVYLIGNAIPNENGLAIVSQWQFIQVIIEIFQEALVYPIFFFVGSSLKSADKQLITDRVLSSFKITIFILLPISLLLFSQLEYFIDFINTPKEIIRITNSYLKIKLWAMLLSISNLGFIIIIESLKKKRLLLQILVYKMALFILFDTLFFGGFNFSMELGIKGVALSSLVSELLLFLSLIGVFKYSMNINLFHSLTRFKSKDLAIFRKISLEIGLESLIRNIAYLTMIGTLINSLGTKQIGGYYLAMQLFWGVLLVPIIALSDTLKVIIANNYTNIEEVKKVLFFGLRIGGFLILSWILIIPFIEPIFFYFNQDEDLVHYAQSTFFTLFIPYAILSIGLLLNSVFYGLGKTNYLIYKSLITNLVVYLTAFLLYKMELWIPTFTSILILFSIGIFIGILLNVFYLKRIYASLKKV